MTPPQSNSCSHPETAGSLPATNAQQPESAVSAEVLSDQPPSNASLQQQLERERLISRIALQVFQSSDLSVILKAALDEIRQFLRADRVAIERCWQEGETTTVADSVGTGWQPSLGEHCPDVYGSYWHTGQRSDTAIPNATAPAACLSLPILRNGQPWGALLVYQCGDPRPWDAAEVQLLEQLTTQLAIAIHHSELHQEIQRLNDHLESEVQARTLQLQQAYEFEATLKRITDRVRDSLDVDLILQAAVRELAIVMKVRGCNASLYDLEEGTSTTCYEYTNSLSPYQGRISKFSAAQELYSQLLKGQYFQFCSLIPNPERGVVAMLACPILDDQGVIGDLWVIHHCDHAFGEQDIRLVQQVANQCAIALRQAHLYSEVQAEVRALERLNQLKDDFLSTVSHELRTPLSNIKMAIHMLRMAPTAERQQRYLQILEAECSRETELINDLLDLQRLENESYSVSPEPIQLQEWLPTILAPFLSRAQSRQQHLHVNLPDDQPPLSSDRKSLERILAELLNNACKYTSPNGSIALHVKYDPQFDARQLNLKGDDRPPLVPVTTFVISNQADIPATEVPRMFEKFYRIPKSDPWQQGGTGLGLALVKKLVETLQGTIHADSYNGWTILTVHFPMLPATH